MEQPKNPYVIGNSVGNSPAFVGRDDVLREVLNVVRHDNQNAIILFGQRRIGKTSVLRELEARLPKEGDCLPVFFDLQDHAKQSLGQVLQTLANKISERLPNVNSNLASPPEQNFQTWLAKISPEKKLVMLLDEFDAMASNQQQTTKFFIYLRDLLENLDKKRINFVLAVGRNATDLNDIAGYLSKSISGKRISLFKYEDTVKLIHLAKANNSLRWSKEAVKHVWQQTNGHPFITQCLCHTVWNSAYENKPVQAPEIALEHVDKAIPDTLEKSEFSFEWLWAGLGPAEQLVAAALASAGAEPRSEKQLKQLLHDSGVRIVIQELKNAPQILQNWDLIEPTEAGYRFRVELLRQWIAENKPLEQMQGKLDALDPEADELYKVAENFYKSRRFDAAIGSFRQVISINPHHVKAHLQLADILIKQRRDNEAREILEQLYDYNPVAARNLLVEVLLSLAKLSDDKREQRQLYERVLEIDPKNGEAKRILQTIKGKKDKMSAKEELATLFNAIVQEENGVDGIFVASTHNSPVPILLRSDSQTNNGRTVDIGAFAIQIQPLSTLIQRMKAAKAEGFKTATFLFNTTKISVFLLGKKQSLFLFFLSATSEGIAIFQFYQERYLPQIEKLIKEIGWID